MVKAFTAVIRTAKIKGNDITYTQILGQDEKGLVYAWSKTRCVWFLYSTKEEESDDVVKEEAYK